MVCVLYVQFKSEVGVCEQCRFFEEALPLKAGNRTTVLGPAVPGPEQLV